MNKILLTASIFIIAAVLSSCNTSPSGSNSSSSSAAPSNYAQATINSTNFSNSGFEINAPVGSTNIITIANSYADVAANTNHWLIVIHPNVTGTGYSTDIVITYFLTSSVWFSIAGATLTSYASSAGQHFTGTFSGTGMDFNSHACTFTSGTFDAVR